MMSASLHAFVRDTRTRVTPMMVTPNRTEVGNPHNCKGKSHAIWLSLLL
jgi:hypothetical protein